jgi:hypothetical protein
LYSVYLISHVSGMSLMPGDVCTALASRRSVG